MLSTTGVGGKPPALPDDARPPTPPTSQAPSGAPTGLAPAPKPAASTAELERRLADLERQLAASSPTPAQTASALTELAAPADAVRYVASVEDAEKHLELTPSQKADLERVIADTAREREALHRLPGEDGKTWDDAAKETFRRLDDGSFMIDGEALAAFRERQIPGRGESFGAADRRLTEEAKRRIEAGLSPDQRRKLEKTNLDPLVGAAPSGGLSFSFVASPAVLPAPEPQPAGGK